MNFYTDDGRARNGDLMAPQFRKLVVRRAAVLDEAPFTAAESDTSP
jgi:hypothetical protein